MGAFGGGSSSFSFNSTNRFVESLSADKPVAGLSENSARFKVRRMNGHLSFRIFFMPIAETDDRVASGRNCKFSFRGCLDDGCAHG